MTRPLPARRGLLATLVWLALGTATAGTIGLGEPWTFSERHPAGSSFMQVRLLGSLRLGTREWMGLAARELSGIAWDEDEGLLYAVSDDGHVVHLRPSWRDGLLAGVDLVAAYPLRDGSGLRLPASRRDAEGLALSGADNGVRGDSELVVSFEGTPRIERYTPRGELLGAVALPAELAAPERYRDPNRGLEAVAAHPLAGLLTAPERPLAGAADTERSIHALDGRRWWFRPLDPAHSDVVGLEVLDGGDLLVLERRYVSLFHPVVFALRRLGLAAASPQGGELSVREVARFSNREGWHLDNFEGLAHHRGRRYFLVSDDNESAIQKTLLVYLEVLPQPASTPPS